MKRRGPKIGSLCYTREVFYLVGDFTDTTEGSVSLAVCWFLWRLLWLSLHSFIDPFVRKLVSLFLLVSKDGQTELAAKVHEGAVVCWDRDHVPGLDNLPAKSKTRTIDVDPCAGLNGINQIF